MNCAYGRCQMKRVLIHRLHAVLRSTGHPDDPARFKFGDGSFHGGDRVARFFGNRLLLREASTVRSIAMVVRGRAEPVAQLAGGLESPTS